MNDYATKPIRARVLSSVLAQWLPAHALPSRSARSLQPGAASAQAQLALLGPGLTRSQRAVELFLKTIPEFAQALSAAIARRDVLQVRQLAHRLKGSCASLGVSRMAAACHDVELAALEGVIDADANARIAPSLAAVTPLLTAILTAQAANDPGTSGR